MKNKKIEVVLLFLIVILPLVVRAAQLNSSNYEIYSYVISSGGSDITSGSYKTDLSLGTIAGNITSTSYKNYLGFWYTVSVEEIVPPSAPPSGGGGGGAAQPIIECNVDSDCEENEKCKFHRCVKLFDVEILRVDSPVEAGQYLDFTYLIKGMADISDDVTVNYWIKKNGTEILAGQDVIYLGEFEQKIKKSNLYIYRDMLGKYDFYVQISLDNYRASAYRPIEVVPVAPLILDISEMEIKTENRNVKFRLELNHNKDEAFPININETITRNGTVVWKKTEEVMIQKSKTIEEEVKDLEPGDYNLKITANYGTEKGVVVERTFTIEEAIRLPSPLAINWITYTLIVIIIILIISALIKKKKLLRKGIKAKKSELELKFEALFNKAKELVKKEDLAGVKKAYYLLYYLYKRALYSNLSRAVKYDYYRKLLNLYSEFVKLSRKRNENINKQEN